MAAQHVTDLGELHGDAGASLHLRRQRDGLRQQHGAGFSGDGCGAGDEVLLHRLESRRHAADQLRQQHGDVPAHGSSRHGEYRHERRWATRGADAQPAVWRGEMVKWRDADGLRVHWNEGAGRDRIGVSAREVLLRLHRALCQRGYDCAGSGESAEPESLLVRT